jgi:hypothetical protein
MNRKLIASQEIQQHINALAVQRACGPALRLGNCPSFFAAHQSFDLDH